MTARPELVALLTDFDVERGGVRQRFVRRDGRPFTAEERELIVSATDDDMRAAGQLAAVPQRLTELIAPSAGRGARGAAGPVRRRPGIPGSSFAGPGHFAHMRGAPQLIGRSDAAQDPDLAPPLDRVRTTHQRPLPAPAVSQRS